MLSLLPTQVSFAAQSWPRITSIAIDRTAARQVVEWSDAGPHAVFVDVPEQRIDISVTQDLTDDGAFDAPRPAQAGIFEFTTAPGGSDARRVRVSMQAVILSITHDHTPKKFTRTIRLLATAATGATDPITTIPV